MWTSSYHGEKEDSVVASSRAGAHRHLHASLFAQAHHESRKSRSRVILEILYCQFHGTVDTSMRDYLGNVLPRPWCHGGEASLADLHPPELFLPRTPRITFFLQFICSTFCSASILILLCTCQLKLTSSLCKNHLKLSCSLAFKLSFRRLRFEVLNHRSLSSMNQSRE
jgi:hypothetical protein